MSPQIVSIEDAGPARKARRLIFDDGTEPRLTSAAVVKQLELHEGAQLNSSELEAALAHAERDLAKQRAIQLLSYRDRSIAELNRGLRDSGYSAGLSDEVVARMRELCLVDDGRFAGMWVRTRLAAGIGSRRILRELNDRGVDPEVASAAVQTECPEDDELQRATVALRGARPNDRRTRDKLIRRLVSRGFALSVALQAVEAAPPDEGGASDT